MPPLLPDPPPAFLGGRATLSGVVLDALSGHGIRGATVYLTEAGTWSGSSGSGVGQPARAVYVTDEHGIFRIQGLRDRRYHLDVEAPGFLRFLAGAVLGMAQRHPKAGLDELHLDHGIEAGYWHVDWDRVFGKSDLLCSAFPLVENGRTPPLRLHLQRGQTLRGAVKDDQGRPLFGATITVESQGYGGYHAGPAYWGFRAVPPNRPTCSDAEGRFSVVVPPGCQIRLLVQAPGRPEERRSIDLLSHAGPLEIALGGGCTIRGRVLNPPDHDIRLIAFEPKPEGRVWESTAAKDGSFAIDGLVGVRWVVAASAFPCGGAASCLIERLDIPLELRLESEGLLEGKVVDAAGIPQAGALIGQDISFRFPAFTATLESYRGHEDKRVRALPDGVLSVPTWMQGGFASTDPEGCFRMKTILDQQGEVLVSGHVPSTSYETKDFKGWVRLGVPSTLVATARTHRLEPPARKELDVLLEHLRTGPPETRRKILTELRRELDHGADRPDLLPHFLAGMADEDAEVRSQAIQAMTQLDRPEAFEAITGALRHEDWSVRHSAIYGLGRFGRKAEPLLRTVLSDEKSAQLRLAAAGTLAKIGAPVDVEIFYQALREDDDYHGVEAQALLAIGRKEAIALLIDALKRSTSDYSIQEALRGLTGVTDHWGARGWDAWLEKNRASLPPQAPLEGSPPDAEACCRRGVRLHREGHPEKALEWFTRALEKDPAHAGALRWRGYLRLERGEAEGAEEDFTRLLGAMGEHPNDWLFRAQARARRKDAAGARADIEKALSLAPADWPYRETARRLLAELN